MLMARVTVVGAGIAGLTAALYAVTAGHHVVVLDRTNRLGGRGTSQTVEGAPFGYGLHLLHKRGPLMKVIKKISRLPLVLPRPAWTVFTPSMSGRCPEQRSSRGSTS